MDQQRPETAQQFRTRVRQYRDMALTSTTTDVRDDLLRLAERFEALAKLEDEKTAGPE
jgi:hypothetical protein